MGTGPHGIPVPKFLYTTHFDGQKIIYAEKEWGIYECHLNDGTQIDFYKKGEWKKVDCNNFKAVPDVLIPRGYQAVCE